MREKLFSIQQELEEADYRAHELTRAQMKLADRLFISEGRLGDTNAALQSARSTAIIEKKIQQKEHGANASLRDAHEFEYLAIYHKAVKDAEEIVAADRHELEQNQRDLSNVRLTIQVLQSRAKILMALLGDNWLSGGNDDPK